MDVDEGVGASAPGMDTTKIDGGSGVSASKAAGSKEKASLSPEELAKRRVDRKVKAANLTVDISTKKRPTEQQRLQKGEIAPQARTTMVLSLHARSTCC